MFRLVADVEVSIFKRLFLQNTLLKIVNFAVKFFLNKLQRSAGRDDAHGS